MFKAIDSFLKNTLLIHTERVKEDKLIEQALESAMHRTPNKKSFSKPKSTLEMQKERAERYKAHLQLVRDYIKNCIPKPHIYVQYRNGKSVARRIPVWYCESGIPGKFLHYRCEGSTPTDAYFNWLFMVTSKLEEKGKIPKFDQEVNYDNQ